MTPREFFQQFVLAVVFLTRLPLGGLLPDDEIPLRRAMWAFPLAGALVGAIAALPLLLPGPALVTATLSVVLAIWLTGGLHEDGLADFTDGMGGQTRAERLRIMRDSHIGSYGTLALICCLLLRITSLAVLGPLALIAVAAGGRAAMVLAAAVLPAARPDGLGRAAGQVAPGQLWAALVFGLLAMLLTGAAAPAGLIAGLVIAGLTIRLARNRLGGQTGDVLGSVAILTETAILTSLAIMHCAKGDIC